MDPALGCQWSISMGQAVPPLTHMHSFKTLLFEAAPYTDYPLGNTDTFRIPHHETERCSRERQTKPHSWLHSCGLSQLGTPNLSLGLLAQCLFCSGSLAIHQGEQASQPLNQLIIPMQEQAPWGGVGSSSTQRLRVRGPDNGDSRGAC